MDAQRERELLDAWRQATEAGRAPDPQVSAGLEALFGQSRGRLVAVCKRVTGNEERAHDLAQEALLVGWTKLHEFRGEGRLSTWLYGIARGLSLNAVRRHGEVLAEDGILDADDPGLDALSQLRREEREALFREASATLEPLEQEAIWLRYVEELPQDRITELLGLDAASGARGLLQRCRRHLERELRIRLAALGHGSSFFRATR